MGYADVRRLLCAAVVGIRLAGALCSIFASFFERLFFLVLVRVACAIGYRAYFEIGFFRLICNARFRCPHSVTLLPIARVTNFDILKMVGCVL